MVTSFYIFMFLLQPTITPFLRGEAVWENIFIFIIIYLFIFAENSIGLVSLWMSELSLALACAVGYFDLRPFSSLVGRVINMMH